MARKASVETAPRLPRAARQAQLLGAAAKAFAGGGFAATSMEDVAAEAGVTKLIVYRHFSSKDELYGAVLLGVAERLREEYERELARPDEEKGGFAPRAMLTVAREQPDAFRLLTVHAVREPRFVVFSHGYLKAASAFTDELIGDMIPDPVVKAWAGPVVVDYVIQGVLAWLDVGTPTRDHEFIDLANRGLYGLFVAWADPERLAQRASTRSSSRDGPPVDTAAIDS